MYDILNSDEYTEMEGRRYLNPEVALNESNQFIDNLRSSQQADNQKIQMDTYNLGTNVSSNLGGLTSPVKNGNGGAGLSYFTSRYQVPQTASAVANLRSAAQAAALNQALQNEQEMWKKRYNDAYRAYQKSAYDKANTPAATEDPTQGGTDYIDNTNEVGTEWGFSPSTSYQSVMLPDGEGGTTGVEVAVMPDGTNLTFDHRINYNESNMERAAGADQLSDIFTGMYNYSIPGGYEVELGGWDEQLRKGSDGNYYIYNKPNNTYQPIVAYDPYTNAYYSVNGAATGRTEGGSRWWKK